MYSILYKGKVPVPRDATVFRITVDPAPDNGPRPISQIQADKVMTVARERGGGMIGRRR